MFDRGHHLLDHYVTLIDVIGPELFSGHRAMSRAACLPAMFIFLLNKAVIDGLRDGLDWGYIAVSPRQGIHCSDHECQEARHLSGTWHEGFLLSSNLSSMNCDIYISILKHLFC